MKLLGIGSMLLASLGFGLVSLSEKRERMGCLRDLCAALVLFRAELGSTRVPLPRLIHELCGKARGQAACFLRTLDASLEKLGERSFCELWEAAANETLPLLTLEEREALNQCGKLLGRFSLEEQLAALDEMQRRFASALDREQQVYREDKKLRLWLPTAAGALLVILLL